MKKVETLRLESSVIAVSWRVQPLLLLGKPDFLIGNFILAQEVIFEGGESALLNGGFYPLHKPDDEAQVVDGGQPLG